MLFYSISALMEFLMNPDLIGANTVIFRIYYILAAPLVGLLGAGVMYLLARKTIARLFLGFVIVFSLALLVTGILTPLDSSTFAKSFGSGSPLANGFMAASEAFPMTVRIFAIILNSVGGLALILGAIYSFARDRSRTYNILSCHRRDTSNAGRISAGIAQLSRRILRIRTRWDYISVLGVSVEF